MSMIDWAGYRKQLSSMIAEIAKASPDIVRGYRQISAAHAKDAPLDDKTRELIALAVAVTLRCDGCIASHVELAKKHGATEAELADALGIAITVNAGATLVFSARTMDAFRDGGG